MSWKISKNVLELADSNSKNFPGVIPMDPRFRGGEGKFVFVRIRGGAYLGSIRASPSELSDLVANMINKMFLKIC